MRVIGKIECGTCLDPYEFEIEVENWEEMKDEEKDKAMLQCLFESGLINVWYEEKEADNETT